MAHGEVGGEKGALGFSPPFKSVFLDIILIIRPELSSLVAHPHALFLLSLLLFELAWSGSFCAKWPF